jgi:hypothetical protein
MFYKVFINNKHHVSWIFDGINSSFVCKDIGPILILESWVLFTIKLNERKIKIYFKSNGSLIKTNIQNLKIVIE